MRCPVVERLTARTSPRKWIRVPHDVRRVVLGALVDQHADLDVTREQMRERMGERMGAVAGG